MKPFFFFIVVFLFVGSIFSVNAQDKIILKDGNEIQAKVVEISPTEIKYKRFDNLYGPTIVIPAANVFAIDYENGTRQVINTARTSPSTDTTTQNYFSNVKAKRAEDNKIAAFALNLILGFGIGSFIQGDSTGGLIALAGELYNLGFILVGELTWVMINGFTFYPAHGLAYIGYIGISAFRIFEIIRPFTYANRFSVAISPAIDNKGQPALAAAIKLKL